MGFRSTNQLDKVGSGNSEGITGLTASAIQGFSAEANIPDFDLGEVWKMVSGDYSILRWQE